MVSFIADKIVMDGLTYDDVLLVPGYSEVLPRTVSLETRFSRHIELKIPFVTAAMDTVYGHRGSDGHCYCPRRWHRRDS